MVLLPLGLAQHWSLVRAVTLALSFRAHSCLFSHWNLQEKHGVIKLFSENGVRSAGKFERQIEKITRLTSFFLRLDLDVTFLLLLVALC